MYTAVANCGLLGSQRLTEIMLRSISIMTEKMLLQVLLAYFVGSENDTLLVIISCSY